MSQSNENAAASQGVDINHAASETAAWRNFMSSIDQGNPGNIINGYYIPLDDIKNILNYAEGGVRTYFALRNSGNNAGENVHLYIVPLDARGNDILQDDKGNSLIYDTTLPCPSACGEPNPLNSNQ